MNKQNIRPIRRVLAVILSLALLLTFTPLSGMVTLSAGALETITYIGTDGTEQTVDSYTLVTSYTGTNIQWWSAGNYVVQGDVTISTSIYFSDTVNLILCDGAHLTVIGAIANGKELNIFAQSTGNNKGKLTTEGARRMWIPECIWRKSHIKRFKLWCVFDRPEWF